MLHNSYSNLKYVRCQSDWSVYLRRIGTRIAISATSVDDILLATNSKEESELAAEELNKKNSPLQTAGMRNGS